MIKEHSYLVRKLEILFDIIVLIGAANVASSIYKLYFDPRFHADVGLSFFSSVTAFPFYYLAIIFFSITILYYLYFDNIYYTQRFFEISTLVKKISAAIVKSTIIVGLMIYIISSPEFPLSFFFVYSGISLLLLVSIRVAIKIFLYKVRKKGVNTRHIVILGTKNGIIAIKDRLLPRHKGWGIRIDNTLDIEAEDSIEKFESILKTTIVDDVFVSCDSDDITVPTAIKPFLLLTQDFGKSIRIFMNPQNYMNFLNSEISFLGEYPTLFFSHKNFSDDAFFVKRILDIIAGIVGCVMTLAILPFVALAIKCESKGPIFFKQMRIGNNRRPFVMYKFRTTVVPDHETKNELEITKVGNFLKKFSIDELPQFFNVLKGDLNLVGIRPPTPDEIANYDSWHHKKISIKPGLTGIWRISKKNSTLSFDDIVDMDLKYIDNWSILLDLMIILKSFRVVFLKSISFNKT